LGGGRREGGGEGDQKNQINQINQTNKETRETRETEYVNAILYYHCRTPRHT